MSVGDTLTKAVETLEAAIRAKKLGLPSTLVVLIAGRDDADQIKQNLLDKYNLESIEVLLAAGTRLVDCRLPWLLARNIERRPEHNEENCSHTSEAYIEALELTDNAIGIMGISATGQKPGAPARRTSHKEGAAK